MNGGNVTYIYDGDGNRVAKTVAGINSWANVVPTPRTVHLAINDFFRDAPEWLPEGYENVRQWMTAQDWETQWKAGLEIWKQAMTGGPITWQP